MRSLSNGIDFQTMLYVYFSYFQPHILYGISISIFWANWSDAITVFRKQKKIIRLITKSSFGHPCRFRRLKMFLFHLCSFFCTSPFWLFLKTYPTTLKMNPLLTLLKPYTCNFPWTTGFIASRSTSSLGRLGSGLSRMLVLWLKVFYITFTMNVFNPNLFLGVADLYLFVALFSCLYFKFWLEA